MIDLTKQENVVKLMESSQSGAEWNANCDKVKAANGGYPEWWFHAIVLSGLFAAVQSKW